MSVCIVIIERINCRRYKMLLFKILQTLQLILLQCTKRVCIDIRQKSNNSKFRRTYISKNAHENERH